MARHIIRKHKRAVHAGTRIGADDASVLSARGSALSLLARSVGFGHSRLAVIRLGMAVRVGAEVPPEHWAYCRLAADSSRNPSVKAIFLDATKEAQFKIARSIAHSLMCESASQPSQRVSETTEASPNV